MAKSKKEEQTFERSLERLDAIVEQLGEGTVSLDEALKLYEEGLRLSRTCADTLRNVEVRLKKIEEDADGTQRTVDMKNLED